MPPLATYPCPFELFVFIWLLARRGHVFYIGQSAAAENAPTLGKVAPTKVSEPGSGRDDDGDGELDEAVGR